MTCCVVAFGDALDLTALPCYMQFVVSHVDLHCTPAESLQRLLLLLLLLVVVVVVVAAAAAIFGGGAVCYSTNKRMSDNDTDKDNPENACSFVVDCLCGHLCYCHCDNPKNDNDNDSSFVF